MRALLGNQPERSAAVAEQHQILAQQPHAFRPALGHLVDRRDDVPVTPLQSSGRRPGPIRDKRSFSSLLSMAILIDPVKEQCLPDIHLPLMMRHVSRAGFCTAGAAVLAAPRLGGAQSLVKLRIASPPNIDYVGAYWAQQSGIFARNGLDADVTTMNSGADAIAALLGGSLDIARSSMLGLVEARARGLPLIIEVPSSFWSTEKPNSALVIARDSTIRSGRDLNGKTLSVPAVGDLDTIATSAWIDQNGGDSRTVKFLSLPHRAAAEAIVSGRISAANIPEPNLTDAIKSGRCRILGRTLNAIGKRFVITAYFCTADFAAKNVDTLARFRKSMYESGTDANAHRSAIVPVISKFTGVDEKMVAATDIELLPTSSKDLNPPMIQPLIDAAVKYKAIPAFFPARDMIDPNA